MKTISLNFFGEEISSIFPKSLTELRATIAEKFMFDPKDAAELVLSYMKDLKQKFIETEEDFVNFIKDKINKIDLDINENSQLFLKNMEEIQDNLDKTQEELDTLLILKAEKEKESEKQISEKRSQIMECDKRIQEEKKKKLSLSKEINEEIRKMKNETKEDDKKISELQKKLGLPITENKKPIPEKVIRPHQVPRRCFPRFPFQHHGPPFHKMMPPFPGLFPGEVHFHVSCDGCNMNPIIGKRYKCCNCDNFDYCEKCYNEHHKKDHFHEFKVIEQKNRIPQPIPNPLGKKIHVGVRCDGCNMFPIIGDRYKCSVCPNFDFCEKCEEQKAVSHGHPFLKMY